MAHRIEVALKIQDTRAKTMQKKLESAGFGEFI